MSSKSSTTQVVADVSFNSLNSLHGINGINGINGTNGTQDDAENNVHKEEGLKVIICGGGIGGLTAAISLRRQGHQVDIYEQSQLANEVGAAIHMAPNATGVLKQLGVDPRESGAIDLIQVFRLREFLYVLGADFGRDEILFSE